MQGELIISSWFLPLSKNNSCIYTHACHFMSFLQAAYVALSRICSRTAYCMFTLFPTCGICAELAHCLQSTRKAGNCEIQILYPQLKMYMKRPPHSTDRIHYYQKQVKKQEKVSLLCQTFHKMTVKTTVHLSASCFSSDFLPGSSSPDAISSLKSAQDHGPASFWQDTRKGSTCFLSSDPRTAGGCPRSTAAFLFPSLT